MVAEAGHAANRVYVAQDGSLHLNGGKLWSASEVDVTAALAGATSTATVAVDRLLRLSPQATEAAYGAAMTIDVTYSYHIIPGVSTTSATVAFTPSAAGTAGDVLIIETTATSSGTVTATFSSTFHSSGTQATTASKFSTIMFVSDGTQWNEIARTTALT